MSNYRKTMSQALQEMYPINEDNIDLMRKAAGGAAQTVKMKDGKLKMDMFTASAIMQILDKVNPANKKKMTDMINKGTKDGMMKLQDFAMKQVKSENDPEIEEEVDLDEGKMKDLLIKAQELMGPSKNRKEGIQMVAKGLKVSEKEATKLVDEVIKMKMNEEVGLDEANKLPDMRNALMQVRTGEVDLDEAQDGGDFKPHMMYDPKTGKGYKADTMDDHLKMKKMGYTHDAPKTEEVELDEAKYTRKLMKDKSVVDYVKSQQARNRKKEQGYEHGANWVELAAKTVGMEKMSLSKKKAFDWESEYEAVAKKLGEEVDLDEGKLGDQWQKGAKSVKSGSFELVRGKSGVHDIMKSGKKIGTFSYDDEGDNFVANMKGERGQLVGNDIDTLISNFKEEVDLDEGKQKPYVSSDSDGKHVMGASGKIVKSFKDMDSANAYLKKNYNKLMKEDVDLDEGKMSQLHQYIKDKKSAEEIAKLMKVDVKTIKTLMSSNNPEDVEESAASDARRAMSRDKDLGRGKDSADDDDDATDDDVKGASKNIMMQLRKAQSLKGRFDVEFADGKKTKVSANIAMAVQQKYNAQKRPAEKEKFQAKIGKSYKDMLSALKEELQPKKESILERMNRKIKENKDG